MESLVAKISIMLVPALFAVTLHEVAHGYLADRFGDPTARLLGRLTLNPVKHLDPIGTLALLFFGFGWARPVPINFNNLRHPKRDMIWVSLVGPSTNLTLAILSALLLRVLAWVSTLMPAGEGAAAILEPLALMVAFSLLINVILGVFNLIPIPPLDGGRVLTGVLPAKQAAALERIEPFGFVIIIFLVFFTDVWQMVLQPVIFAVIQLLAGAQTQVVLQVISFLFAR